MLTNASCIFDYSQCKSFTTKIIEFWLYALRSIFGVRLSESPFAKFSLTLLPSSKSNVSAWSDPSNVIVALPES